MSITQVMNYQNILPRKKERSFFESPVKKKNGVKRLLKKFLFLYCNLHFKMKPWSLRKKNPKKRRASLEEPVQVVSVQETVIHPSWQAKLDIIHAKEIEFESISKIQQQSEALATTTANLAKGIRMLTDDADNVVDILAKWDVVFGVMGDSERHKTNRTDEWVRFLKPQDSLESTLKEQKDT